MDERFVSLASFLRVAPAPSSDAPAAPIPNAAASVVRGILDFAHADVVHDLALLRLAAYETFERTAQRMLRTLALDVLARETLLAPADIDGLVAGVLAAFSASEPIALAVSPIDRERVHSPFPLRIDPSLEAGDLIVDVRDGTLESRFAFRLDSALERAAHAPGDR